MLTHDDVVAALRRITYRPDWAFTVNASPLAIQARVTTTDAWGTGRHTQQGRLWLIMDHHTVDDVFRTAFAAITALEEHERREFFRVDNQIVWNPHAPVVLS